MTGRTRIKILYVVTTSDWGGAQRYVYDLATALPKEEYKVSVAYGGRGTLAERLAERGVATYAVPSLQRDISPCADLRALFGLRRHFRLHRPDIAHLNSTKAGGLGALAARCAGVPRIIFTVHGWPFEEQRNIFARAALWFFSWCTALLCHRVIVLSDYDLRATRRMPFVSAKTNRIYNGIGQIDFLPRTHQENENAAPLRILTVAELTENKNLFAAIDAVALARTNGASIHYSIMGKGELKEQLRNHIARRRAAAFVTLLGFVPDARRRYRQFDLFFLPSKKEGLPYVLLEAGLAELAVVASDVGGIPEIIRHEEGGLLSAPSDVAGCADALRRLAAEPAERRRLAAALQRRVVSNFSLRRMLAETATVYRAA